MDLSIQSYLSKFELKAKRGTERTDMIAEIVDIVNKERFGTKFPKVSFITIYKKVEHLDDSSLRYTLSICNDAKRRTNNFSKCFFGSLKVKSVV